MKGLISISLLLLLSSCADNDYYHNPFTYDNIIHYTVVLDQAQEVEYLKSLDNTIESNSILEEKPTFNKELFEIVYENDKISTLSNSDIVERLESIGFTKNIIPSNIFWRVDKTNVRFQVQCFESCVDQI